MRTRNEMTDTATMLWNRTVHISQVSSIKCYQQRTNKASHQAA